jgi:glucan phosphoethanolaminetransferase (alkaline phosphatase superfamily)
MLEKKEAPLWQRSATAKVMSVIAAAALAAYVAMNHLMFGDVIHYFSARGTVVSLVYLAWMACGFVVFFALVALANRWVLLFLAPFFLVSLVTNYAYIVLGKRMLSLDVMEWMPHELAQSRNAWSEFHAEIIMATVEAVALLGIFVAIRLAIRRHRSFSGSAFSRRSAQVLATGAFFLFSAAAVFFQPPNTMAETNLYVFGLPALFSTTPDLRSVSVAPARPPLVEKIILVVDESVTHAIYDKVIAPAVVHLPALDFGEAASTANCSAASNALLRWGLEKDRLTQADYDPRTNPTIWGYARTAGFRTVLIDGQSNGAMHNYLSTKEVALIDEFVPAFSGRDTDHKIAAMLNDRLARPGREFIYVVKHGTHFPYEMNYPAGAAPDDAPRPVKYAAAVSYSSRGFFDRLARDLELSGVLLIYTSDHGQDLVDRSTHCNPNPRDAEYSVPLIVVTRARALHELLGQDKSMHSRASHLNIFPTLLYSMGYAREWLEATYGPTLAGPPAPYITYVSLGWTPRSARSKRHTVESTAFVRSVDFPRRKPSERVPDSLSSKGQ